MSRSASVRVLGDKSVMRRLRRLPERLQRHVMRPAVTKAATPVVRAARKFAPKGAGRKPGGTPRKHLKQTMKKTRAKWYPGARLVAVTVGPEKNASPHSHLVHDGTQPHDIKLGKPLVLNVKIAVGKRRGGKAKLDTAQQFLPRGLVIKHPGSKATPFLARAVYTTRPMVQAVLQKEILAGIDKQVKKLAAQK